MFEYEHPHREKILKRLFNKNYKNILDVGASKHTTPLLKKYFPNSFITGVNVELTRENRLSEIFLGNAEMLPFKDNSFDLIFSIETLEHILFPDKFIKEAKRVLKPGGDIILDTPNLNTWSNRLLMLFGFPPTNYTPYPGKTPGVPKFLGTEAIWDHPRVFPYKTLKEIFSSDGFELKKICGLNEVGKGRTFRNLRLLIGKIVPSSWRDVTVIKATLNK